MAASSRIEWTEATWNPVTGCSKVSEGCAHCYAERMAKRLRAMGVAKYRDGFAVRTHPSVLTAPTSWRRPSTIFINSMSDLFHDDVPDEFIAAVFETVRATPHHRYQVLTKRADRMAELARETAWPDNLWAGVTVESAARLGRVDRLREVPAPVRFLSLEPLLGPLDGLDLTGIDWVIVGGESGPGARRLDPAWVLDVRDRCLAAKVPFFFKQWGGVDKKRRGRLLEGRVWEEIPG